MLTTFSKTKATPVAWIYHEGGGAPIVPIGVEGIDLQWFRSNWFDIINTDSRNVPLYRFMRHLRDLFRTPVTMAQARAVNQRLATGEFVDGLSGVYAPVHRQSEHLYNSKLPFVETLEDPTLYRLLTPFLNDQMFVSGSFIAEQLYGKGTYYVGGDIDCYFQSEADHEQYLLSFMQWLRQSYEEALGQHAYVDSAVGRATQGETSVEITKIDSTGSKYTTTTRPLEIGTIVAAYDAKPHIKWPEIFRNMVRERRQICDNHKRALFITEHAITLRTDVLLQVLLRPFLIRNLKSAMCLGEQKPAHIANPDWLQARSGVLQPPSFAEFDSSTSLNIDFFDPRTEHWADGIAIPATPADWRCGPTHFACPIQVQSKTGTPEAVTSTFDFAHTRLWYTLDGGISGTKQAWMAAKYRLLIPVRSVKEILDSRFVKFLQRGFKIPTALVPVIGDERLRTLATAARKHREEIVTSHV